MLLVDAGVSHEISALWYYSSDGAINSSRYDDPTATYSEAQEVFRVICSHAVPALWADYAPARLGGVTISASSGRLDSEAFFAREHYNTWLRWITDHRHADTSARELWTWMRDERELLSDFVSKAIEASAIPLQGTDNKDARGPRLLDVGCGAGDGVVKLLKANSSLHAVGVDIIERNISEGWQRIHHAKLADRAAL